MSELQPVAERRGQGLGLDRLLDEFGGASREHAVLLALLDPAAQDDGISRLLEMVERRAPSR